MYNFKQIIYKIILDPEKKLNEPKLRYATFMSGKLRRVILKNKFWKKIREINNILCGVSSNKIIHFYD